MRDQTYLISDFIQKYAKDFPFKPLNKKALVHGHCHHKAVMKIDAEKALLERLGVDYKLLESGCCGMAGGFGFEKEHYDISVQVGDRVLIPAIKKAPKDTLVITNGFSCREQITQTTGKEVHHIVQLLKMSIDPSN